MRARRPASGYGLWRWRAALELLLRGLGRAGALGLLLMALAIGYWVATSRSIEAGRRAESQLAELLDSQRRARMQAARPVQQAVDPLAGLPVQRAAAGALPVAVLKNAERCGLKLNAVEYRSAGRGEAWRRVDVLVDARGSYPAARRWVADALLELPHAQLRELSIERSDPGQELLGVRVMLSLHFRAAA